MHGGLVQHGTFIPTPSSFQRSGPTSADPFRAARYVLVLAIQLLQLGRLALQPPGRFPLHFLLLLFLLFGIALAFLLALGGARRVR